MFVKPTAPRSVGGVFEDAFRLYRQLGSGAWLLALAFQLVVAVPSLLWQLRIMPVLAGVAAGGMEDALPPLRVPPALWLLTLIAIPLYLIFYLALIAVSPEYHGIGLGSRLLKATLKQIDLAGLGAYVESSNPKNATFYERNGFVALKNIAPAGAPSLIAMWRNAK